MATATSFAAPSRDDFAQMLEDPSLRAVPRKAPS